MAWWEEKKKKKTKQDEGTFFGGRAFICLASGFGSGSHGEKTAMIDVWKLRPCLFWWICQTLAGVISEIRLERGRSSPCLQTDRAEVRPPLSLALCYTLLALSGGSCWWPNKGPVWRHAVLFTVAEWSQVSGTEAAEPIDGGKVSQVRQIDFASQQKKVWGLEEKLKGDWTNV